MAFQILVAYSSVVQYSKSTQELICKYMRNIWIHYYAGLILKMSAQLQACEEQLDMRRCPFISTKQDCVTNRFWINYWTGLSSPIN